MSSPFVGEIRMFGGSFAPAGWAFCDGQTIPISENDTLFTLIGTTYGGDGQETFCLPNLQSRIPVHQGTLGANFYTLGEMGGVELVTLTTNQIPAHSHPPLAASGTATSQDPANAMFATAQAQTYYNRVNNITPLVPNAISPVGGSQPHDNMQPYLVISFIISLYGVFPTQN